MNISDWAKLWLGLPKEAPPEPETGIFYAITEDGKVILIDISKND